MMQAEQRKLYSEAEACVMLSVCEKVLRRARDDKHPIEPKLLYQMEQSQ